MTICSTRFSHSCSATPFGYAIQSDSRIHALQQSLFTHFNQILAFILCSTVWLRTSTIFLHSCPATHSLVTHFNQILAFMPCNIEFGYALQPDYRIHALQHSLVTLFNQILAFMLCNSVWLRTSTRFSHSCSVAQLGYALQPDSCIYALQHIVWLRTSTRFLHSCPATHSLVTHFNQILAFMPCNTELGLRTSTRFSNSCPAIQSLVTHFNQILAFMPCNTEFDYALQPDSRIHALQHRVWLRTSTRFSNSCPAIQSLVTHFNQILEFMPCNT
jgi:hypothetical protein